MFETFASVVRTGGSRSLTGLTPQANVMNRDTGCVRCVTARKFEVGGVEVEVAGVVIVMDYSVPLDLPVAVIPRLSPAGSQKHTGVKFLQ